jgi:hypothetical protein
MAWLTRSRTPASEVQAAGIRKVRPVRKVTIGKRDMGLSGQAFQKYDWFKRLI